MELRGYWRIVRKRIWVVFVLVAIVLAISLVRRGRPTAAYIAFMRFTVGLKPEESEFYSYDRYYTWMASEYLVDELTEVVKSHAFAEEVGRELAAKIPVEAIRGSIAAERKHRILTVHITWGDEGELREIADAASRVLQERSGIFFGQLGDAGADIRQIDPPRISPAPKSLKEKLDFPIRIFLALLAGLALTFLLDYLDDTIRDRREVEEMGLAVLAEIPPLPGRRWFFWRKLP
jgi:capsular polysaccharide biosynthesis protein